MARVWRSLTEEAAEEVRLHPAVQEAEPTPEQWRLLHKTIQAVTHDLESLGFNTAISRLMEFNNALAQWEVRPRRLVEPFVLLLSPLAPHLAEELWELLGHPRTLAYEPWPEFDPRLLVLSEVEIPVQVGGKLRGKVRVPTGATQEQVLEVVRQDPRLSGQLSGRELIKVIFVADRMLNLIVK